MKVNCSLCNQPIDLDTMAAAARVSGWVEWKNNRPHGQVREASAPLGWAHMVCVHSPAAPNESLF